MYLIMNVQLIQLKQRIIYEMNYNILITILQSLVYYGADGFYIAKPQNQRQNENTYKIKQHQGHNINKRAFGNAVTDILGGVQHVYDHWISNSGGGGNLVQRIPAKFYDGECQWQQ